ncbi:MAG: G-D-S-L family lipolytic protein [Saprospiraceae bacterium]|nr:G-D-S-L family lipolytic protein [Saprospiraceae bacterium]
MIKVLFFLGILITIKDMEVQKKILFFGDSITEGGVSEGGFISKMKQKLADKNLQGKYELSGSGISGNKVYDLFFRLEKDVISKNPDVVVIWIGVNDVWHKSTHGTGTDLDKFELMYVGIIQRLQEKGIRVFCCTPACIGEKTDHSNPQDGDLNEYSKTIRKMALEHNTALIDIRSAFLNYNLHHNVDNQYQGILTSDGVHLNDVGSKLVSELMWDAIIKN